MGSIRKIEELFQAAAELAGAEREAYLDRECAGDPELRARVGALLERDAEGESLIGPGAARGERSEGPGTVIGRYKLLQHIGDGGFGSVYMAEQTEPIQRKVALKIIKLGMDTRQVVARFEAERQALALMDHPGIARVLDGGATETGRPYFVMELVRGVSITEYCDKNNLSTAARLDLFAQVCQAVQHAHQKGVIHRDLKPSNVLVTLHDGQPVPKVIDFGIAKAMHGKLTEKTLFTEFRQFIGTPAYMSPEQAEMSGLDVDTRTDIYSLGVLLYELLTGTTPFDTTALVEAGYGELQRIIREEEPPVPSVRISTQGSDEIARHRQVDPAELSRSLRGDLDWIVMRALEKDRARRYASASELGEDVRRHMSDEPVLAGPPSAAYKARKFLARNRTAVLWGAALALALGIGFAGTYSSMVRANRELQRAQTAQDEALAQRALASEAQSETALERDRARAALAHARAVTDFLTETLAETDPMTSGSTTPSMRELLDRAARNADDGFGGQREVEASVRSVLGRAYKSLGELERATTQLDASAALMDELVSAGQAVDGREHYETLWILTSAKFTSGAVDSWETALRARRVGHDHVRRTHPDLAAAFDRFVNATDQQQMDEAEPAFAAARELARSTLAVDEPLWLIWADTLQHAGYSLWYTPFEARSAPFWLESYEIQKRVLGATHPKVAETLTMVAGVLNRSGSATEAEALIRDSVTVSEEAFGRDNTLTAFAVSMLGENLTFQGRYEEAEPLLLEAHQVLSQVSDRTGFVPIDSLSRILGLYDAWARPEAARPFRDALVETAAEAHLGMPYPLARLCFDPVRDAAVLAELDRLQGINDLHAATRPPAPIEGEPVAITAALERLFAEVEARWTLEDTESFVLGRMFTLWGDALTGRVPEQDRELLVERALVQLEPWRDAIAPVELADALALRSQLALAKGNGALAGELARQAWTLVETSDPNEQWPLSLARMRVGCVLTAQGFYDQAEALLRQSLAVFETQQGMGHRHAEACRAALAELELARGR